MEILCHGSYISSYRALGTRVKSGNFGHQVNLEIHLQTVEIQMRWLLMSRLIRIFTVCLVYYFFLLIINTWNKQGAVRIYLMSEVTRFYPGGWLGGWGAQTSIGLLSGLHFLKLRRSQRSAKVFKDLIKCDCKKTARIVNSMHRALQLRGKLLPTYATQMDNSNQHVRIQTGDRGSRPPPPWKITKNIGFLKITKLLIQHSMPLMVRL